MFQWSVSRSLQFHDHYYFQQLTEITIRHYIYAIIEPCDLFPFNNADAFILRSNEITEFQWCCYYYIQTLDLSCNNLTDISILAYPNSPLQFLNLSHNKIEFLQIGYFSELTQLSQLDLSHNRIMQFALFLSYKVDNDPRNIGCLPHDLNMLDLSNNHLTYIPTTLLTNAKHLSDLNLGTNRITYMEEMSFQDLVELYILDLSANHLTKLSLEESPLDNGSVEYLRANNCSRSMFRGLVNLRTLIVSQNNVLYLPQNSFCDLKRLEMLDLAWNHITFLSRYVFIGLDSLTILILRGNRIRMVESNAFLPLDQVNSINLGENCLSGLSNILFDANSKLELLQLHNNSFVTVPLVVSK